MDELNKEEQLSEPNKVLVELEEPSSADPSEMTSITELENMFQGMGTKKHEFNKRKRSLQTTEKDLRSRVIGEIEKRWKAIEHLKTEIMVLQKRFNELTPLMFTQKSKLNQTPMWKNRSLIIPVAIAVCLSFYSLGIATDFFAAPAFSAFFLLSYNTAHQVAYGVALAAEALIAGALILNIRKVRAERNSILFLWK